METQLIGDDDEIPMRKETNCRDAIHWPMMMKFRGGLETIMGMQLKIAFTVEFQSGKETIVRIAIKLKSMMKFQWEPDQYSTELNIQNPSVESRFWEEKNVDAK